MLPTYFEEDWFSEDREAYVKKPVELPKTKIRTVEGEKEAHLLTGIVIAGRTIGLAMTHDVPTAGKS